VDGLTGCGRDRDKRLLHAVQLVQLALERGDAGRALRHRQRVIGRPLNLAHDEGKYSVGEQRGQQGQRITGVLGDIPGRGLGAALQKLVIV